MPTSRDIWFASATIVSILLILANEMTGVAARDPFFESGVSRLAPDGSYTKINAWPLLTMELETRGPRKGFVLNQSVLNGFVAMSMDRMIDPQTQRQYGPIKVTMLGRTVYDNTNKNPAQQASPPTIALPVNVPPLAQPIGVN